MRAATEVHVPICLRAMGMMPLEAEFFLLFPVLLSKSAQAQGLPRWKSSVCWAASNRNCVRSRPKGCIKCCPRVLCGYLAVSWHLRCAMLADVMVQRGARETQKSSGQKLIGKLKACLRRVCSLCSQD